MPDFRLSKRLGLMANALVGAKVGPSARFFTRECVDEMVLLMREAEKRIIDLEASVRLSEYIERDIERKAGLRD